MSKSQEKVNGSHGSSVVETQAIVRKPGRLAYFIVWTFLASIFLIWVVALLVASGLLSHFSVFPELSSVQRALAVFAIGLTICCGILWVGHVTSVIILREKAGRRIWATLIVVVVGAAAASIVGILRPDPPSPGISVDDMILIDETALGSGKGSLTQRPDHVYEGETDRVGFVFTASGFETTKEGQADLLICVRLYNPSTGVAEIQDIHKKANPGAWKATKLGPSVMNLLPDSSDRFAYAGVLADRKPIGTGKLQLQVRVIDLIRKTVDSQSIELLFRPHVENVAMKGEE